MVTVYSKQAARFNRPGNWEETFEIEANVFEQVPDWVLQSQMYKMLEGNKPPLIQAIYSKADVATLDKNDGKIEAKQVEAIMDTETIVSEGVDVPTQEDTPVEETESEEKEEETQVDYSSMKTKELYALCVEKGIECEEKQPKDYYIELLTK